MKKPLFLLLVVFVSLILIAQEPPVAKIKPVSTTIHGDTRVDNYVWMKKKNSGAMKKYLKAENNYTEAMMADTKELQEKLYEELLGRVKETDKSVPYLYKGYWYYYRTVEGKNYIIFCRKKGSLDNEEEILMDVNEVVAEEKCYGAYPYRPHGDIIAYAIDKTGNYVRNLHFKELSTGNKLQDQLKRVSSHAWASDNKTIFYTVEHKTTNRSYQLYRHVLCTSADKDVLIYEEKDDLYDIYVYPSKSERYIFLEIWSSDQNEFWYLPADEPFSAFKLIHPREEGHEYYVSHFEDKFYITTNKDAVNFKAVTVDVQNPSIDNWQELIPHREDVLLDDIEVFKDYMVVSERAEGNDRVKIKMWETGEEYYLPFEEEAYVLRSGYNPDFNTKWLRVLFSSLKTPNSTYEVNIYTKEKRLLKQKEVPSGHDPDDYVTEKIWASASDGERVPMSIIYKKGISKDGSNPVYIDGYGAYGLGSEASFYYSNLMYPLIDRGFIYAIAHVRGGDDLGRKWYYDGKMLNKKNTFTDFIACTEHLIKEKYTSKGLVVAEGRSAGGLLAGAIINMRPDLYNGVILEVPFVDVINTMMDTLLPLTTQEFIEWGNPYEEEYYNYIKSYAPYENVRAIEYPNLLFISGVTDEQVGIWEPAKMVAKLRAMKKDDNLLLFKVTFKGGHGGASGRYSYFEDVAFKQAWILKIFEKENQALH